MSAITISRQYGSGGSIIASRLCETLGYRLLDRQLIMQAAADVGLSDQGFVDISEQKYKLKGLSDRLSELLLAPVVGSKHGSAKLSWGGLDAQMDRDWFIELVNSTILNAYHQGSVVILGRGGQIVLKDRTEVLHVRVEAPIDARVQRVQQAEGLDARTARQRIDEHDQASARYLHEAFKVQWDDPLLYHLIMNTGKWDLDTAAQVIIEAAKCLQAMPTA